MAAVEAGLKQAAENKRRKIGNPKKQKKMKTAPAVALLAEFPSAPVTAVLDQTTVVTPMVKTLLDYWVFFVYGTFSDVYLKFGASFFFGSSIKFWRKNQCKAEKDENSQGFKQFLFVKMVSSRIFSDNYNPHAGMKNI